MTIKPKRTAGLISSKPAQRIAKMSLYFEALIFEFSFKSFDKSSSDLPRAIILFVKGSERISRTLLGFPPIMEKVMMRLILGLDRTVSTSSSFQVLLYRSERKLFKASSMKYLSPPNAFRGLIDPNPYPCVSAKDIVSMATGVDPHGVEFLGDLLRAHSGSPS